MCSPRLCRCYNLNPGGRTGSMCSQAQQSQWRTMPHPQALPWQQDKQRGKRNLVLTKAESSSAPGCTLLFGRGKDAAFNICSVSGHRNSGQTFNQLPLDLNYFARLDLSSRVRQVTNGATRGCYNTYGPQTLTAWHSEIPGTN